MAFLYICRLNLLFPALISTYSQSNNESSRTEESLTKIIGIFTFPYSFSISSNKYSFNSVDLLLFFVLFTTIMIFLLTSITSFSVANVACTSTIEVRVGIITLFDF